MNYVGIDKCSSCNGEGFRVVLWVSGCDHKCKGCHNKDYWNVNSGKTFTIDTLNYIISLLDEPYMKGITFSGGDPLHKSNIGFITNIARAIKVNLPNKDIWLYTGSTYEEVKDLEVFKYVDYVVDGEYVEDLRDISLAFKGSSNQRIIDVKKGSVVG